MAKPTSTQKRRYREFTDLRKKRVLSLIMARMGQGEWLRVGLKRYDLSMGSFFSWLNKFELNEQYTQAKELLGHALAQDTIDLCDEVPPMAPDGKIDNGAVNWMRLRVDTRKWLLSKVTKQYSERKDVNLSGELNTKTTIVPTFKQFVESNVKQ